MPRNRRLECVRQADYIELKGTEINPPCFNCRARSLRCIIILMDCRNTKCAFCTRGGIPCTRHFYSDKEWRALEQSEKDVSDQLLAARAAFAEHSRKVTEVLARITRLEKQQNFLKERGSKMLAHDTSVSESLDIEDPPSASDQAELLLAAEQHQASTQVTASSEDITLNQLFGDDLSLPWGFDVPVVAGIPEPISGNSQGSQ
jgi:hypothetical protein